MRFEYHPEAYAEYDAAAAYYAERQPGLELRFIDEIDYAIRRICESPERWRRLDGKTRRFLVHVFPYALLYVVENDFVHILAVMHCHRKPGYWKKRA